MTQCPAPAVPTQFDMRGNDCLTLCNNLLQAYYRVISGSGRVTVRFQERWTEYQKGNANELRDAYRNIYLQCPAARAAGLPDLNPANMTQRGAPARGFNVFPRL